MTSMDAKSSTTKMRSKWAKKNDLARSSARGWPTGPRRFGLWGGAPSKWGTRRQLASSRGVSHRQGTRCKALKNEEIGVARWSGTGFALSDTWRLPQEGGSLGNHPVTQQEQHMSRAAVAMLFAVALAAPTGLAAQNQWERVVRGQIREHSGYLTERGYDMISEVFQGRLGNHENETLTIDLQAGPPPTLLGVCDQDSRAMDLRPPEPAGDGNQFGVRDDDSPVG